MNVVLKVGVLDWGLCDIPESLWTTDIPMWPEIRFPGLNM